MPPSVGTPTGNLVAPVIKVTGNARTARQMADNIDMDVSSVIDTLDQTADPIFAEGRGHRESAIPRRNPTN